MIEPATAFSSEGVLIKGISTDALASFFRMYSGSKISGDIAIVHRVIWLTRDVKQTWRI